MKKLIVLLVLFSVLIGCKRQSELNKTFDCTTIKLENTSTIKDFNKNFKISIPITWKTSMYYNEFQSEIFTADTTKQLTETFILDVSYNIGELKIDNDFIIKNDSILHSKNLKKIKSGNNNFQLKQSYWFLVNGTKNNFPFHQFNIYVKLTENSYLNSYVEIYGEDKIDERLCTALSILENIEFLQ